jgi:hypothetical protein
MMGLRIRLQLAEAFGPLNRWYCAEFYGHEVHDKELLLGYYIGSGGAEDFAERFAEAIGDENRWYCSEFYGRQISDEQILWEYYVDHIPPVKKDAELSAVH